MAHARAAGVLVSFDTNLRLRLWPLARARAVMQEAMRTCDLCLPSWDDVTVLLDCHDRDGIVDTLLGWGVKLVALKMGAEGCYVATPEYRTLVPRHTVNAVDATGDGTEGLWFAENHPYDVILLDLMLPGTPGLEILRRLRAT